MNEFSGPRVEFKIALGSDGQGQPVVITQGFKITPSPIGEQMEELSAHEILAYGIKASGIVNASQGYIAMAMICKGLEAHHGDLAKAEPKAQIVVAKAGMLN